MKFCKLTYFIFFVIFVYSIYSIAFPHDKSGFQKALLVGLVGVLVLSCMDSPEMFHFEVTPWKKTCLSDHPCPQCCSSGFHGQPVEFEYTSDADRMNASLTCAHQPSGAKNNPDDYQTLSTFEGFSNSDYVHMNDVDKDMSGSTCSSCAG